MWLFLVVNITLSPSFSIKEYKSSSSSRVFISKVTCLILVSYDSDELITLTYFLLKPSLVGIISRSITNFRCLGTLYFSTISLIIFFVLVIFSRLLREVSIIGVKSSTNSSGLTKISFEISFSGNRRLISLISIVSITSSIIVTSSGTNILAFNTWLLLLLICNSNVHGTGKLVLSLSFVFHSCNTVSTFPSLAMNLYSSISLYLSWINQPIAAILNSVSLLPYEGLQISFPTSIGVGNGIIGIGIIGSIDSRFIIFTGIPHW